MNELQRILHAFEQSQQNGKKTVLATVVRTSGSVYRRPGARMLVTEDKQSIGAISGGCLEADILERSLSLLSTNAMPVLVRYDTTSPDDIIFGLGLGCNGVVEVLLEPLNPLVAMNPLSFIQACFKTQKPGASALQFPEGGIATIFAVQNVPNINVGDRLIVKPDGTLVSAIAHSEVVQTIATDLLQTLANRQTVVQSYRLLGGQLDVLLEAIRPPVPLLIFGAGYDAIPVVQFAKQLGWHATVIDHRPELLTRERFPYADQLLDCIPDPPQAYQPLLTPQTVAVVMTHRYISDLAFLKHLIPAPLRYLGVLGPKRRMQQLWRDLADYNIFPTNEQSQRLYSPVGLDMGAETPEEIALSIVAEIQTVISGQVNRSLRDRSGSIHPSSQSPCLELVS